MHSLFKGESEHEHVVIDSNRAHLEAGLSEQKALIALPDSASERSNRVRPENCADVRRPTLSISVTRKIKFP